MPSPYMPPQQTANSSTVAFQQQPGLYPGAGTMRYMMPGNRFMTSSDNGQGNGTGTNSQPQTPIPQNMPQGYPVSGTPQSPQSIASGHQQMYNQAMLHPNMMLMPSNYVIFPGAPSLQQAAMGGGGPGVQQSSDGQMAQQMSSEMQPFTVQSTDPYGSTYVHPMVLAAAVQHQQQQQQGGGAQLYRQQSLGSNSASNFAQSTTVAASNQAQSNVNPQSTN